MGQVILKNNICSDQALLKQVQQYKRDGTVPWLVDKNFGEIALAMTIDPSSKVTFLTGIPPNGAFICPLSSALWGLRQGAKKSTYTSAQ